MSVHDRSGMPWHYCHNNSLSLYDSVNARSVGAWFCDGGVLDASLHYVLSFSPVESGNGSTHRKHARVKLRA
jgi:hypothetical protein